MVVSGGRDEVAYFTSSKPATRKYFWWRENRTLRWNAIEQRSSIVVGADERIGLFAGNQAANEFQVGWVADANPSSVGFDAMAHQRFAKPGIRASHSRRRHRRTTKNNLMHPSLMRCSATT
jgi:hypothetical protein